MKFDDMLLVDKPTGISSFGVVARVRGYYSRLAGKKVKVGHTGTLDPFASGLMILMIGSFCKRAGEFSKLDKSYEATLRLGEKSTTGDLEGELSIVSDRQPSREEVDKAVALFVGNVEQTPPIFSAIKINGQRAYKLARAGKEIEMPRRVVRIFESVVLSYEYPFVRIRCHVSSGTYIRTLAEDIGKELGVGAYLTELRRTVVGDCDVEDAHLLSEFDRPTS